MDKLSAHKGERVRELVESAGCELLYLPPYSPDFSPIEEAFSKVKGLLRKAEARSRKALVEAIGKGSMRSPPETQDVSSSIADTALWVNCFDQRCRRKEVRIVPKGLSEKAEHLLRQVVILGEAYQREDVPWRVLLQRVAMTLD